MKLILAAVLHTNIQDNTDACEKAFLQIRRPLGVAAWKTPSHGGGEQFLLLLHRAQARVKGMFFPPTETGSISTASTQELCSTHAG